jgi:hypothetical protein
LAEQIAEGLAQRGPPPAKFVLVKPGLQGAA